MSRQKMFGPGGIARPYRPKSAAMKRNSRVAVRKAHLRKQIAMAEVAKRIKEQMNPASAARIQWLRVDRKMTLKQIGDHERFLWGEQIRSSFLAMVQSGESLPECGLFVRAAWEPKSDSIAGSILCVRAGEILDDDRLRFIHSTEQIEGQV